MFWTELQYFVQPICLGAFEPILRAVVASFIIRSLDRGEILYSEHDDASALYVVERGVLRSVRLSVDGREQVLSTERQGSILAAVAIFGGGKLLFMDVATYNRRVMGPAPLVNVVEEAVKTSLTRRTVSHITIPKDIQEWIKSESERSSVIGRSCLDARDEVLALAAGAPVIKGAARESGNSGSQFLYDRRHRTPWHSTLARRAEGMRHVPDRRQQFPLYGVSAETRPGEDRSNPLRRCANRVAAPCERWNCGGLPHCPSCPLPFIQRKKHRSLLEKAQKRMADWNHLMEERGTRQDMPMKPRRARSVPLNLGSLDRIMTTAQAIRDPLRDLIDSFSAGPLPIRFEVGETSEPVRTPQCTFTAERCSLLHEAFFEIYSGGRRRRLGRFAFRENRVRNEAASHRL